MMNGSGTVPQDLNEYLSLVKNTLAESEKLIHAERVVSVDMMTECPANGIDAAGDVIASLSSAEFRLRRDEKFVQAVIRLYERRDELDEYDRILAGQLYTDYMRTVDISEEQYEENERIKNKAWADWMTAKEANDFTLFADSLERVIASEKRAVMAWRPVSEHYAALSAYDRMLDIFERGITSAELDKLFGSCRERITALLGRIKGSCKHIRTDFLSRRVTAEQQKRLSAYLLGLIGFDMQSGTLSETEHPFTELISKGDVRVTTHYYEDNFMSNFYTILHEGGHALFEQMQPAENFDHFISSRKTMGMHESVSRFYENIIGRSRSFIHLVYPELCNIFPQVFFDVSEQELYEAVNSAEPSLIRVDADELTYTLHIIIRYEIEKQLIDGDLAVSDIPEVWKARYEQYLGVSPDGDRDGALQDSHWTSDFGYFPTYVLGNFYNAMYARKMRESIDIDSVIESGDLSPINAWMSENFFAKADRMDAAELLEEITGTELTADCFLDYLEEKYTDIYRLNDTRGNSNADFDEYIQRMVKIRKLSAPYIDYINSANEYSSALAENFRNIGRLAEKNRDLISETIDPILRSAEMLSEEIIEQIHTLNINLMDAYEHDNIDLPVMMLLSERLMEDAKHKNDDNYLIRQLDEQIIAGVAMIVQTRRIVSAPEITVSLRKRNLKILEELLSYLDKDKFIKLDMESRELVMINSRYGDGLFISMTALTAEERRYRFEMMQRSLSYASDPFYREALPDYDWTYHVYRVYQYISSYDEFGNCASFDDDELQVIADYGDKIEELWLSDRTYFEKIDSFGYIHAHSMRNRMHAGRISPKEYTDSLYRIYRERDSRLYDVDSIIVNVEIPREYISAIKYGPITEQQKGIAERMYRSALSYVFNMPKDGTLYELMDYYAPLLFGFIEFQGGITFEEMGLRSFAAFHPPTYIHSTMVAKISRCLTSHLIKRMPELFVGICGCPSADKVPDHADSIESFTYHAALCHDFGKLVIIDTVSVYGRKIFDFEFDIIKEHPNLGAMMLEKHNSTREYADIAKGHHVWYNGERGYPQGFDIAACPVRTIIDIVACADCMDAATDSVGRSYSSSKTLDDYINEVGEGSGTHYAPYLYDMLREPEVYEDIQYLLTSGRQEAYRNAYFLLKNVYDSGSL